jgi:hypothetical protein
MQEIKARTPRLKTQHTSSGAGQGQSGRIPPLPSPLFSLPFRPSLSSLQVLIDLIDLMDPMDLMNLMGPRNPPGF